MQHLDGHNCGPLQFQRWPASAPVMGTPGSDDSGSGSPALPAPEAAAEDTWDQALSQAKEAVQAEVAAFGEEQREALRLKLKSLDEMSRQRRGSGQIV